MLLVGVLLFVTGQDVANSDRALERIREALAKPPLIDLSQRPKETPPTFRVRIEGWRPRDPNGPPEPDRRPSAFVRSWGPTYHNDFLTTVAPRHNRGPSFGVGIDVIPMIMAASRAVSAQVRKVREQRAKREVQKAYEEFLAARAARIQ